METSSRGLLDMEPLCMLHRFWSLKLIITFDTSAIFSCIKSILPQIDNIDLFCRRLPFILISLTFQQYNWKHYIILWCYVLIPLPSCHIRALSDTFCKRKPVEQHWILQSTCYSALMHKHKVQFQFQVPLKCLQSELLQLLVPKLLALVHQPRGSKPCCSGCAALDQHVHKCSASLPPALV